MAHLAFILLDRERDIAAPVIATALNKRAPGLDFTPDTAPSEGETVAINFDRGRVMIVPVSFAVPNGEADGAYRFSIAALSPAFKPAKHHAHLIVTMMLEKDQTPLEAQLLFTRVVAAVLESTGAVAVYWGEAGVTHPADFFFNVVGSDEHLWTMLWTGVSLARQSAHRLSILSLGMRQFGLLDAMLNGPVAKGNDLLIFMMDMLRYCIERGSDIPEGDTIGRTPDERLKVKYVPSPIDATKKVWFVEFA